MIENNKELNIKKMIDIVGSFKDGFGNRSNLDMNNAIFIAIELHRIDLEMKFIGIGNLGVESPELYRILRDIDEFKYLKENLEFEKSGHLGIESTRLYGILLKVQPNKKYKEVVMVGRELSKYDSRELNIMALYLWNKGRNTLGNHEKDVARVLLRNLGRDK